MVRLVIGTGLDARLVVGRIHIKTLHPMFSNSLSFVSGTCDDRSPTLISLNGVWVVCHVAYYFGVVLAAKEAYFI